MQATQSLRTRYSSGRHSLIKAATWTALPLLGGLIVLNLLITKETRQIHIPRAPNQVAPQEPPHELGLPARHSNSMPPPGRNNIAAFRLERPTDEPD